MTGARRRLCALYCCALLSSGCSTLSTPDDPWVSRDKFFHFGASAMVGAIATQAAKNDGASECRALSIGIGATALLGTAKEFADLHIRNKDWSWPDLAWDMAGGTLASVVIAGCH